MTYITCLSIVDNVTFDTTTNNFPVRRFIFDSVFVQI